MSKLTRKIVACFGMIFAMSVLIAATPATSQKPLTPIQRYSKNSRRFNKRISLNFSNIKTRELLQIMAQFSGVNFVVSDSVSGSMSVHLENIPWQQALEVIMRSQGLGKRHVGNAILIAPASELTKNEVQALKDQQQIKKFAPMTNRIVFLKYANAEDVVKMLGISAESSMLSEGAKINFDKRTNSIWIHDRADMINTIIAQIKKLDKPEKQVLIDARIVKIERPFDKTLGVKLGITQNKHLSGTLEGANTLIGLDSKNIPTAVPLAERLNFSLPAASITGAAGSPASIGLALAKLGSRTYLDLSLSALEREGHIETISSPRLITSNRKPAYIKQGEEIPYEVATSSGATSIQFKDAVLSLKVTPEITPDNRVMLDLVVSNNSKGTEISLSGGGSAIPINLEEESAHILLNNHQTVVLGGVYKRDKQKIVTRVPFFGTLPILGHFFRSTQNVDDKTELLIFITPHIITNPSQLK